MATKTIKRKKNSSPPKSIVIKYEVVDPKTLNFYYKNPRIGNVEKVAESLAENNQYKPIVVNIGTRTGRPREVLAGNHTLKGVLKLKWSQIEVAWVDVDNAKARAIVLADNGSSDDSTYDDSVLTELLSQQKKEAGTLVGTTYDDGVLSRLVKQTSEDTTHAGVDTIEDAPEEMAGVADLANGVFFPSDIPYEFPELLPEMIPDKCPRPIDVYAGHELDGKSERKDYDDIWWLAVWHTGCRGINWSQSIPCFYTDDFHFEPVYNDPAKNTKKILNLGMKIAMMPNYTITPEMPIAMWVWAYYRSLYVARYFQEAGLQVIPDIQTGSSDEALDITLLGIPENCGVVSAQVQTTSQDEKTYIRQKARLLKEAEDRLGFKSILLYGYKAADEVAERADFSCEVIRVQNRTARRRAYLNSEATINSQKIQQRKKKRVVKKSA